MVKIKLDEYFNNLNELIKKKGLEWHVSPYHYWLELRIMKHFKPWESVTSDRKSDFMIKPQNTALENKNLSSSMHENGSIDENNS